MKNQLKWSLVLSMGLLLNGSCQKDPTSTEFKIPSEEASTFNHDFSKYIGDPRVQACRVVSLNPETDERAAAENRTLWQNGQTVTVSFMGGSEYVRSRVIAYAKQWEEFANIKFEFVQSNGMIRVAFIQGAGAYSHMGRNALAVPANQETMNFGWFDDNTSEAEFSRTTLHEFGHALGLIHEHQHPEVELDWDREFTYQYYAGAPNYWSRQQVDVNLLNTYTTAQTTFNAYDETSIMHYPILGRLVNRSNNTPENTVLSAGDKQLIGTIYPF